MTCGRIGEDFVVSGCFLPSSNNTGTDVDNTVTDVNNDRVNNGEPLINYHLWTASVGVQKDGNNIISSWVSETNSGQALSLSAQGSVEFKNGSYYPSRSPAVYLDESNFLKNDTFNFFNTSDEYTQVIVGMVAGGSDGVIYHDSKTGYLGEVSGSRFKVSGSG